MISEKEELSGTYGLRASRLHVLGLILVLALFAAVIERALDQGAEAQPVELSSIAKAQVSEDAAKRRDLTQESCRQTIVRFLEAQSDGDSKIDEAALQRVDDACFKMIDDLSSGMSHTTSVGNQRSEPSND